MTEVLYRDLDGLLGEITDVYTMRKKPESLKDIGNRFEPYDINDVMLEKELSLRDHLEEQGCEVLKVSSKLISKRRYKRRLAKLVKKEKYKVRVI